MKTLVLTGYDSAFEPIGRLTTPLMEEYAEKHGFEFRLLSRGWIVEHPSWWKMRFLTYALKHYHRVIWMDADIVVTNPEIVPPGESGYHCSQDWGRDATEPWMLSNCCFAAFPDSVPMIRWVLKNKDAISCEFHEQNHMRQAATMQEFIITVHPPRVFNAVPIEIHETVREPWQPGDWCAHLTMVDLRERVRLFHEIRRQSGCESA